MEAEDNSNINQTRSRYKSSPFSLSLRLQLQKESRKLIAVEARFYFEACGVVVFFLLLLPAPGERSIGDCCQLAAHSPTQAHQ